MSISMAERIQHFRTLRGMTQKYFGMLIGFPEKSADVRVAQYETDNRTPKADLTRTMARALDVSPKALTVPDIDTYDGMMHTFFALEDRYGFQITDMDGTPCLMFNPYHSRDAWRMIERLLEWQKQAAKLNKGEITREEYDNWRYCYPHNDIPHLRENFLLQELGEILSQEND